MPPLPTVDDGGLRTVLTSRPPAPNRDNDASASPSPPSCEGHEFPPINNQGVPPARIHNVLRVLTFPRAITSHLKLLALKSHGGACVIQIQRDCRPRHTCELFRPICSQKMAESPTCSAAHPKFIISSYRRRISLLAISPNVASCSVAPNFHC